MHHHEDTEDSTALDIRLKAEGVTPSSIQQALEWYFEGRRVYCFHDMDERPTIALSIGQIQNRTPDQMLVLPSDVKLAHLRSACTVVTSEGYRFDLQSDGTWSDGDMSFDSLDSLYEANEGNLENADISHEVCASDTGEPPAYELRFLDQVRGLVATANRALEEAEQYADKIEDPELKAQANALLERSSEPPEKQVIAPSDVEPYVVGHARIDASPFAIPAYFQIGKSWNGWAKPFFTKEGADWLATKIPELSYDVGSDSFVCKLSEEDDDGAPEVFAAMEIDVPKKGVVKVYPVGAGSWVWDCYLPGESIEGLDVPSFSLTDLLRAN
jgi:hypothetical protein